ncbi:MAG: ABC transporter substrate-binding protein [Leucobacter sp.]
MDQGFEFEGVLSRATPREALSPQIPDQLWDYARAFLRIERQSLKFIWQANRVWLDVTLERREALDASGYPDPKVLVRAQRIELPCGITARELDVLTLTALGLTNGGIAERLGTSARTVSTQLERLLKKLSQATRGGLAALAVDAGLLRLPLPGGAPETGGIGIAALELAAQHQMDYLHSPIRSYRSERSPIPLGLVIPNGVGGDGDELHRGARLAVDELNQQGGIAGRKIQLVEVEVEMFDWQSVRSGLEDLFEAEVAAICTGYVSAEHPGFLELIADFGSPFLHTATFGADVLRTQSDPSRYSTVFQTCASEVHYGPGLLRFLDAIEREGLWAPRRRRILSLEQASESMHLTSDAFITQAREQRWEVAPPISTPAGDTDWEETITRARESDPDVLFVANFLEDELVAFQQALLRDPIPALVYTVYAPSIPSFSERLGAQADGVVWATTTGTYDDELGRRFRRKYTERFGREPGWSQAGAAYDQVRMLAAAWSAVDARSSDEVIRYLRRWPHRGVNGVYYFGEHGQEPLLYPDTTQDAALSQAHLVYQIQDRGQVLLAPEPFGHARDFKTPPWALAG